MNLVRYANARRTRSKASKRGTTLRLTDSDHDHSGARERSDR